MLRAIVAYQRAFEGRPSPCRFFPSCSEYGHEAISVHGPGRGLWLTTRRLIRCRPFGPSGYDPVPLPDLPGASTCPTSPRTPTIPPTSPRTPTIPPTPRTRTIEEC
jgi:putative membrane protein insertion efficiency factor